MFRGSVEMFLNKEQQMKTFIYESLFPQWIQNKKVIVTFYIILSLLFVISQCLYPGGILEGGKSLNVSETEICRDLYLTDSQSACPGFL